MRRIAPCMILMLLLVATLTLAFNIGLVHARAETVCINSDGSVSPSSAPISTVDNVTYTFTGNMSYPTYNEIVVERNNIIIDGNGYTVQGNNSGNLYAYDESDGLNLTDISNVTIENTNIENFQNGIFLLGSNNNVISGNNATANVVGIFLDFSSNNNDISGNNATANRQYGMYIQYSSSNTVSGNDATANTDYGIEVNNCSNNTVVGNNVIGSYYGIFLYSSSNSTVSGNVVRSNSNYGIYLEGSSNNIVISNNATGNSEYCIYIDTSSDNDILENNTVPEFPNSLILAIFMLATLLTIAIYKKKHSHS